MANKLYEESNIQAIANAIRAKGQTGTMTVAQMATKINAITTKESVTWHQCPTAVRNYIANVTYNPSDYSTSQIATYAPETAVQSNTKPIGKTVDGVTYYNEVPNVDTPFASTNTAGTIKPLDALRWLNTSTFNVRDIGGWSCDGGTIRYGMLVRGGEPNVADKDLMVNKIGIRHELQLRGAESPQDYSVWGIDFSKFDSYHWYSIADKALWKAELRVLFDCIINNKPVYFHCHGGADRTGTLACVLEALLGMSQSDIDKDYELTTFAFGSDTESNARRRNETEWQGLINAIKSVPLEGGLSDSFRNRAVSFVLSLGLKIDEINAFRTAMIDGTPTAITVSMDNYTVTKSGSNVTYSNNISAVAEFQSYEVDVFPESNYAISEISVTMNGVDVTSQCVFATETTLNRSITNTLTNCSSSNAKGWAINGQGYVEDIEADSGYEFSDGDEITVTMNGIDITSSAVIYIE